MLLSVGARQDSVLARRYKLAAGGGNSLHASDLSCKHTRIVVVYVLYTLLADLRYPLCHRIGDVPIEE